jgi:DNA recombination protein RmuC
MHGRLVTFLAEHARLGDQLSRAVGSYNKSVGSAEGRLLPSARKFQELKADSGEALPELAPVEIEIRQFSAAEVTSRLMPGADYRGHAADAGRLDP